MARGEHQSEGWHRARRLGPTRAALGEAARLLASGELVAFPTETVYGLGADATNATAVAKLFEAKGRPRFNPLIAHLAGLPQALEHGRFDRLARLLAEAFWPGPLTIVVPFEPRSPISDLARAGLDTVALRVPSHPVARALLSEVGGPVAAPSANRSGAVSPTRAEHVEADLGSEIALILDAGASPVGLESTIVACLGGRPRLLRPGGVTAASLREVLREPLDLPEETEVGRPLAPGRLSSHYAPRARVRLNAAELRAGEALLAFGRVPPWFSEASSLFNLSGSGDLVEAAARLYEGLRALDATGAPAIAVMSVPEEGIGSAINDRLRRAAAPRGH